MSIALVETLKNIIAKTKDVTDNWLLNRFDLNKCSEFEIRANDDAFIKGKIKTCIDNLKRANVTHSSHF